MAHPNLAAFVLAAILGITAAELIRVDGQWLIAKEKLAVVGAAVIAPPAPAPATK